MPYWLMKSEPDVFGIDDLAQRPGQTEHWDGVRNYQARNMMRDQMRRGDRVLFYHSSCKTPGIAGIAEVVRAAYPDHTSWDARSPHYDPKSSPEQPRWLMVDVRLVRKFRRTISLEELKQHPGLKGMPLLKRGNRLSVMPVSAQEWELILELE
ncbi:MAG: EVE domain-containing protein [Gammaproteobacteria bacterium RBG_16_57_12]|nr:MAG: EVE domain-containing protein [Gammaproteobacteria bacterium RBG_16_57_12]